MRGPRQITGAFSSLMSRFMLSTGTPARVSTYAYVNPVVAVFLGWLILGEPVTTRTFVASVIIVVAVAIITTQRGKAAAKAA